MNKLITNIRILPPSFFTNGKYKKIDENYKLLCDLKNCAIAK